MSYLSDDGALCMLVNATNHAREKKGCFDRVCVFVRGITAIIKMNALRYRNETKRIESNQNNESNRHNQNPTETDDC